MQTKIQTPKVQPIVVSSLHNLNGEGSNDAKLGYTEPKTTTARLHYGHERLFSPGIGQSASNTNLNMQTETCSKFFADDSTSMGINVIKEEGKRKSFKKSNKDKQKRAASNGG